MPNKVTALTASWCGHCNNLKSDLAAHAEDLAQAGVEVEVIDCDKDQDACAAVQQEGGFNLTGYPTLFSHTCQTHKAGNPGAAGLINFGSECGV